MTVDPPVVELGAVEFDATDVESLAACGDGEGPKVRPSAESGGLGVMSVDVHDRRGRTGRHVDRPPRPDRW